MSRRRTSKSKEQIWIRAGIACAVTVIFLFFGLKWVDTTDPVVEVKEEDNGTDETIGVLNRITWNGTVYREKPAVDVILFAGIDKEGSITQSNKNNYRDGGQADFLLLAAIDHTDKQIHQLQIDRDAITPVKVLGVFGNDAGMRSMQICLAHSFGATPRDRAGNTIFAVEGLLPNVSVDGYYIIGYSAIPTLNDLLGGISVTVPDDMTSVNPEWTPGTTIELTGADAETFVRARKTVGGGSNQERMTRQGEYMRQAIQKMTRRIADNLQFSETFLSSMRPFSVTNMTDTYLLEEMNKAYAYEIEPAEYLDGEYSVNENGFVEFHVSENSPLEWVLKYLYTAQK